MNLVIPCTIKFNNYLQIMAKNKSSIKINNYDDLVKLYEILKNDDDKIFKWYSGIGYKDLLPLNNVSKLLKEFKIE